MSSLVLFQYYGQKIKTQIHGSFSKSSSWQNDPQIKTGISYYPFLMVIPFLSCLLSLLKPGQASAQESLILALPDLALPPGPCVGPFLIHHTTCLLVPSNCSIPQDSLLSLSLVTSLDTTIQRSPPQNQLPSFYLHSEFCPACQIVTLPLQLQTTYFLTAIPLMPVSQNENHSLLFLYVPSLSPPTYIF